MADEQPEHEQPEPERRDQPEHERRERPKYGEYAPEGWTWQPPKDALTSDGAHESDVAPAGSRATAPVRPAPPLWDRVVTSLLLLVGLFGMFLSIGIIAALPDSIQMIYTRNGLGTYSADDSVPALMLGGQIAQAVIWVLGAAGSVLLMARRRRAFYLPLIAGVVAAILLLVFIGVIAATDGTLLDVYGTPAP